MKAAGYEVGTGSVVPALHVIESKLEARDNRTERESALWILHEDDDDSC